MPATGQKQRTNARARILDAASELFYREGVRVVGVDRIIAESGVAKMTLYNQFGSKGELVAAWLRRRDEDWMSWLDDEVRRRGGGVLAVFDALGDWFASPGFRGCAFINTHGELGASNPLAAEVVTAHKRNLRALLVRVAANEGVADPELTASELLLLVEGAIVTASIERSPAAADTARRLAERLFDQQGG